MFRNYYFLARLAAELDSRLSRLHVTEAFSQEKEKLLLVFAGEEQELTLEIATGQAFPYITLRRSFSRAKRNTLGFWQEFFPTRVNAVDVAVFERVIRITADSCALYIVIRGRLSNVLLSTPSGEWHFFKDSKTEGSQNLLEQLPSLAFTPVPPMPPPEAFSAIADAAVIEKAFPPAGKDIAVEARHRLASGKSAGITDAVTASILDVLGGSFSIWQNPVTRETGLYPAAFTPEGMQELSTDGGFLELTAEYLALRFSTAAFREKFLIIESWLNSELRTINRKVTGLGNRVTEGNREAEYSRVAGLLAANRYSLQKGMAEITLRDEFGTGSEYTIALKPDKSPQENIDFWFEKARSEKTNFEHSVKLLKNYQAKQERFRLLQEQLLAADSARQLEAMMDSLKIDKDSTASNEPRLKFRHYTIDGQWHVFVGKDSKNNDLLTLHFAKQNDIWMHARGVPGSHVILRVSGKEGGMPKPVLKKTAAIAAFHSKAKTAGLTPVSWTHKKYVVKRKGMEPGKVALLREETLLVKPEIPQGCEEVFD